MNRERLKGNLDLLLLSVLAAGPAHGYAVITALRARSDGTSDLPEGTVYPALHRLERGGLLARGPRGRRVPVLHQRRERDAGRHRRDVRSPARQPVGRGAAGGGQ